MDYTQQSLDIIEHNQLLDTDELKLLGNIKEDLNHNYKVGQVFRSRVEMEVSVLNDMKFPTPDSKYWQSIREQNVHFSELVTLSYEYRKTVQEIRIAEAEGDRLASLLSDGGDSLYAYEEKKLRARIEINNIEIEKQKWFLTKMVRIGKDRIREVLNWQDIIERLKPYMKCSLDTYEEHQLESYMLRFENQAKVKKRTGKLQGDGDLIGQHSTTRRVLEGDGLMLGSNKRKELVDAK